MMNRQGVESICLGIVLNGLGLAYRYAYAALETKRQESYNSLPLLSLILVSAVLFGFLLVLWSKRPNSLSSVINLVLAVLLVIMIWRSRLNTLSAVHLIIAGSCLGQMVFSRKLGKAAAE